MGLNQFAKISPIVNSNGFLLEKNQDGIYSASTVKLKDNEIGICIDDKSIVTVINGEAIKLRGGLFDNIDNALDYVKNNRGELDGQLLTIKNNPKDIYVIVGTHLYNITENQSKTLVINVPSNAISENIFNIIENSIMSEDFGKSYLINTVDIKMTGSKYEFYTSDGGKVDYATFKLFGSISGISYIEINSDCYDSLTRCMFADEHEGKLLFSINANNKMVNRYTGDQISLVITYTPLN